MAAFMTPARSRMRVSMTPHCSGIKMSTTSVCSGATLLRPISGNHFRIRVRAQTGSRGERKHSMYGIE
jgi:hypothetical protein